MGVIVDANIVAGLFKEEMVGKKSDLTTCPVDIFKKAGKDYKIFLDEGGQIEQEWGDNVDYEWFHPWLGNLYDKGAVIQIKTKTYNEIIKALKNLGFPNSRDVWYIRVAKSTYDKIGNSNLITEDVDFYEPAKKKVLKGEDRIKFIIKGKGKVAKYLRNKESIIVNCVSTFLSE